MFMHKKAVTFWALTALLAVGPAYAADVDCGEGGTGLQDAIDLLYPAGVGSISVSGTCNESITINGFRDLTIWSDSAEGATIHPPGPGQPGLQAISGSQVKLCGLTIDGGKTGILVASSRVANVTVPACTAKGLTVKNATQEGIAVVESGIFQSTNGTPLTVSGNTGRGITVSSSSRLNLQGWGTDTVVADNDGDGVFAGEGSTVLLYYATVRDNGGSGVLGAAGSVVHLAFSSVTGNGGWGVLLLNNTTGQIQGGGTPEAAITGNAGGGVLVTQRSALRLRDGPVVTGNTDRNVSCTVGGTAYGDASKVLLIKKDCQSFETLPTQ